MSSSLNIDELKNMNQEQAVAYAKNPANRTIVATPVLLIGSFAFYILSGVFAYLGGSDDSIDSAVIAGVADSNAADSFSKI